MVQTLSTLHALPVLMSGQVFLKRTHSRAKRSFSTPKGERKSTPKSTENRRKLTLGGSRAASGSDFWRSERLGRATRSDSGRLGRLGERLGATKSVKVGWSGSVGSVRSRGPPESPGGNSNRDNNNNNKNDNNNNDDNNNKNNI